MSMEFVDKSIGTDDGDDELTDRLIAAKVDARSSMEAIIAMRCANR